MTGILARLLISIILKMGNIIKSDKIILRIYKAHPAEQRELSEIREKLNTLSNLAGISPPLFYITDMLLPGSFIIGKNPNETALVFPKRLLNLMKTDQINAMLAHNLVQINDTIRIRTFAVMAASLMTMSASAIRWGAVFTGFGDYNDPAPKLFGTFIMGLVAPPAATMIQLVTKDDYDRRAAALCVSPDVLFSAIECLENNNTGYTHLGFVCLVDPPGETFFEELFRTHQSRETRIKNLNVKGES